MKKRKIKNTLFKALCYLASAFGLLVLAVIMVSLISKGGKALSWSTLTQALPSPGESGGGLANAIIGSLLISSIGIGLAIPVGVMAGTWLAEYGRQSKLADAIRFMNAMLMSAPSILIGLFVYLLLVKPFGHFSGWAGSAALAIIALPMIISTTEEMLKLVPSSLREAGAGLGTPQWKVTVTLSYRAVAPGLITGILLSFARISGETAPLLFTALSNSFVSWDMNAPMANLPVTIYNLAMSPYEHWNDLAWSGALIITVTVLAINMSSRLLPVLLKQRR
ncbi:MULTISPECIES: phosphate ABC transporter permease PstA [unclassified Vibrio]|uniref:Phosphate transport system permease protein PstA n=1 Tax=Vibrio sp. HB236076 TaxID=3232307 RepID=A0AB39HJK2_9VIBR|nr:phosphate ABC transporter permease PstA [Vibrio sp. HB161653]MDP5252702.1 phosphate ABC transporter permease PstA [Vibrio sp. HB161653]